MRVSLFSLDISGESKSKKLENYSLKLEEAFTGGVSTDLIVLPEFFTTGFPANRIEAESGEGITLSWLKEVAHRYSAAVLASFPVSDGIHFFNRAFFVTPEGSSKHYDKRHLFSYGGEDKEYTKGNKKLIVNFKGVSISVNICYDLRFPVWSRNVGMEYDLLINIANWPSFRSCVIEPLLKSRAIENLCYAAFLNRSGSDAVSSYNGERLFYDYNGKDVIPIKTGTNFSCYEFSINTLVEYRERFGAWRDADKFEILL